MRLRRLRGYGALRANGFIKTVIDPKQEFGNKEESQAPIGAKEPRTGDPRSTVLGHLSWDYWAASLGGITGPDHWAGSLVTLREGNSWDYWAGSLGGITGNLEGGEPMVSLGGVTGKFESGKPLGSLVGITGRDHL